MTRITRRSLMQLSMIAGGAAAVPWALQPRLASAQGSSWSERKKHVQVRGLSMAYYEVGSGDPVIFLHGHPTSSYLWRNIIPHVQHLGRCIAPDMIGMGDSESITGSGPGVYKFATHRDYLFDLFEAIGATERITFVIHDWGSGVGLAYGERYPERVQRIAYMEPILRPSGLPLPTEPSQGLFATFRSPAGEEAVLQNNVFVEAFLIGGLGYFLSEADKQEYRRPFRDPGERRRPSLTWPRELPMTGGPEDTTELVQSYTDWFAASDVPKLFIRANPGAILSTSASDEQMLNYVRGFENQQEATVFGTHYLQEASPHAIGRALAAWIGTGTV